MTKERTKKMVIELCQIVMAGVVKSGVIDKDNPESIDRAVEIMREEVRAFFDPSRDEYKDERHCVAIGSLHPQIAVASIITTCILRIKGTTLRQGERVLEKKDFDDVVKEITNEKQRSEP